MPVMPTRESRHFRTVIALGLIALAACALGAISRQDAARFERIEIVRQGRVVAELTGDANGGVIRLFDAAGGRALDLRLGAPAGGGAEVRLDSAVGVRIVAGPADRERVLFDAAAPPISDDAIKVLAIRVSDLTDEVRNLASRHDSLDREVRDLRPGLTENSAIDRLQRTVDELNRVQDGLERDLRQFNDDSRRYRMDVSSLERRVQRLESRIP